MALAPRRKSWRSFDECPPRFFFRYVLGWQPWSKQLEIADALFDAISGRGPNRIAVRSGNGVGKTALAARLMLWVVFCFDHSVVITTAPTERQVTQLLWREARQAYQSAKVELGGRLYRGQPRWDRGPGNYALGASPEHTQPERFQGFHAPLTVFIVDEASGVPQAHWEAMKGGLLAGRSALLAIGNPARSHGEFYDAFHRHAALWKTFHISAFDTPNLAQGLRLRDHLANGHGEATAGETASGHSGLRSELPIEGLVTPEAIARAREEWGERNDLWQVRVLGQFPQGSASQLIRLEWVEAAARIRKGDAGAECSPVAGTNPESPKDLCALGVNGTAAASHADVSDIAIVRHPAPVVEACVVLAGRAWRRKDLQFVVNPTAGGPGALPLAEVDPEARALLGPYRRVAFGAI